MEKGPSPRSSHEHKIGNSVVKYYTINFTINILMCQKGKPEAECILWKVQFSFSPVFDFGMDQLPC